MDQSQYFLCGATEGQHATRYSATLSWLAQKTGSVHLHVCLCGCCAGSYPSETFKTITVDGTMR